MDELCHAAIRAEFKIFAAKRWPVGSLVTQAEEGFMLPLTAAFFTAALALAGNIIFGLWSRYRDRCGIAAALAGEIGAYMKQLDPPNTVAAYRRLATSTPATRRRLLKSMLKTPDSHPVFDKVADKIGLLPVAEALEVSSIYNIVTGMRIIISNLSSDQITAADDEVQIAILGKIADGIEQNYLPAQDLVERLKRISNERFWRFLCPGGPLAHN